MNAFEAAKAHFFEGIAAIEAGDYGTAEDRFRKSLALVPDRASVLTNLAGVLVYQERLDEAFATATRATQLDPNATEAWLILARIHRQQQHLADAMTALNRAAALRPDDAEIWATCGRLLADQSRFADAVEAYNRALALKPGDALPYVVGDRVHALMRLARWEGLDPELASIIGWVREGRRVCRPGVLLSITDDPEVQIAAGRTISDDVLQASIPAPRGSGHARIRVAYLSPDFRDHAVAYLTAGLYEHHDRNRFETIALSVGRDDGSPMRARLVRAFDTFVDAREWSDDRLTAWIRDAEVDILVDLAGHTVGGRPRVLAARPARVQANYLGYPGSSGAAYIDYVIADWFVAPEGSDKAFTEKVVRLPDCFQANDDRRAFPAVTPPRRELGIPETGFVFCSFNNTYKLTPPVFDVWMRLLHEVPGSVLWTVADDAVSANNLRREAQTRGIGAEKLVFAPRAPYPDHLARMPAADLFLDSFPFNAGTTASDALWVGLPILTCAGRSFAARMSGSLLRTLGVPELVSRSLREYEAMALRLAQEPERLAAIRRRIANGRATAPLFNTERFCRSLERAYEMMWRRTEQGLAPAPLRVPST
jgi:predicted O-linked N-acetylglucosamine transferase (SPINDLY family)